MCKLTKKVAYPGRLLDFHNSEGEDLTRGKGKIPRG